MATDRMRDEAERLVAAALGVLWRGLGSAARPGSGFATGSAECCVCPVCRGISALREPPPDMADRIASGVGDLAATVGGLLRNLTRNRPEAPEEPEPYEAYEEPAGAPAAPAGDEFWESLRRKASDAAKAAARPAQGDDPWQTATQAAPSLAPAAPPAKKAAKKAAAPVKKAAKKAPARKAPTNRVEESEA